MLSDLINEHLHLFDHFIIILLLIHAELLTQQKLDFHFDQSLLAQVFVKFIEYNLPKVQLRSHIQQY